MNPLFQFAACLLLLNSASAWAEAIPPAQAPHQSFSMGYEQTIEASVIGQEVNEQRFPFTFMVENGRTTFELSVPIIQRSAPSGKVASSHHHESKKESSATIVPIVMNQGMGDITSSLEYAFLNQETAPFALSGKSEIKLATASATTGLGTGVNDYFAEMIVQKSFAALNTEASLGYAILGSPGEIEINKVKKSMYFNNIFYAALGVSYQLNSRLRAGLKLELGQVAETGGTEQRDISSNFTFNITPKRIIQLQLLKSLSPGVISWSSSIVFIAEQ